MVTLNNPMGGTSMVHESRLEEYFARGFTLAPRPAPPEPEKKPAKKKTPKKEG